MYVDRRTFVKALVAASATCRLGRGQVVSTPSWVPAGFPAFYEDSAYSNLIVHKDRNNSDDHTTWTSNGGDTAQREGFTWCGIWLLQRLGVQPIAIPSLAWLDAVQLLEDPQNPGEFRRHPSPKWNDS